MSEAMRTGNTHSSRHPDRHYLRCEDNLAGMSALILIYNTACITEQPGENNVSRHITPSICLGKYVGREEKHQQ